jgi:flagellar hook-associated protein 1 FlgK
VSAGSLLSIGTRAMFASQAALQVTGHNIANAHVEGYSRQEAQLATARGQFTGAGFFGKGADVETVARSHDAFLTREAALTASLAAMDSARSDQLQRLEQVFDTGEAGIGYAASRFLDSIVDVSSRPSDPVARQVVLTRAEDLAARLRSAGSQLDALQSGVSQELAITVAEVNGIGARIAQINAQVAAAKGSGHAPNDLLDERDRLVQRLSGLVQATAIPADDGSLSIFIAGGQRLVLGASAQPLEVMPDPYDRRKVAIGIGDGSGTARMLPSDLFGGGRIAGLLRFQNDDLAAASNRIGQIAASLADAVNRQQSLGLDLLQPAGAGAPIFAAGAARVLPAATNARDASGAFVSNPTLAIADASQLQASDYELRADPAGVPGQWQLTRLSDGLVRSIADGATVDGFTLSLGTPAPAPDDRFMLQPVARAAHDMLRVLDDARGIAAASPVTATLSPANRGSATIESIVATGATGAPPDPSLSASITFTDDNGAHAWELRDAGGALVSSGTGSWSPGTPIALNGFELRLAGVPKSGDAVAVAKTAFPANHNGNALALLALRDAGIVGGATVTDAWASALADVGVRVQGARTAADISASVASDAQAARDNTSGVNLDEEAARLIQYQQSYQAAAKILQVAQSVFDTLLDAAGN